MPICPHCHREINILLHGVNANVIVKAGLNKDLGRKGKPEAIYTGFAPGEHAPIEPEIFDVVTEWYSCPECCGAIVEETQVKDKLRGGVDRAAERFLQGVEKYLDEKENKRK